MISYTETYRVDRDGIDDLGLPAQLDERLRTALDRFDADGQIQAEIEEQVTAHLRQHGVDTQTGEWRGAWSARDIVREILDRHEQADIEVGTRVTLPADTVPPEWDQVGDVVDIVDHGNGVRIATVALHCGNRQDVPVDDLRRGVHHDHR